MYMLYICTYTLYAYLRKNVYNLLRAYIYIYTCIYAIYMPYIYTCTLYTYMHQNVYSLLHA